MIPPRRFQAEVVNGRSDRLVAPLRQPLLIFQGILGSVNNVISRQAKS